MSFLKSNMKEEILDNVNEVIKIFEKNKIKIICDYGTLLGCIRYENLIPWDKDIDLSVLCDDNIEKYLNNIFIELYEKNYKITKNQTDLKQFSFSKKLIIEEALKDRCVIFKKFPIDIFFWFKNKKQIWERKTYCPTDKIHNKGLIIKDEWVKNIIYKKLGNIKIPCPEKYEELLTHRYKNWKEIKKYQNENFNNSRNRNKLCLW